MNNFIVPIDFSETSKNAARFAAHIANRVPDAHLILYNVFDTIEGGSDGSPLGTTEDGEDDARKKIVELALQSVQTELSAITRARITCVAEENDDFVDTLEAYVKKNEIQLIIMGITGATRLAQIFIGSNTLNVVKRDLVPVIIVPPDTHTQAAENIMLLTDLQDVDSTVPINSVKKVLQIFNPTLHVVNVDSEHYVALTEEYKGERVKLENMLSGFRPEFSFIRMFDFMEAINQFVADKKIDMIITIPKKHSFLTRLFKSTHTSKLAYHSHVPIVAITA